MKFLLQLPQGIRDVDVTLLATGSLLVEGEGGIRFQLHPVEHIVTIAERGIIEATDAQPEPVEEISLVTRRRLKNLSLTEAYPLLIERFRRTLPDIVEALMQDYKALTGRQYAAAEDTEPAPALPAVRACTDTQLERDLATIRPHLAAITRPDGSINKSLVAKLLNGRAAGSFYYDRVMPVVERLERKAA